MPLCKDEQNNIDDVDVDFGLFTFILLLVIVQAFVLITLWWRSRQERLRVASSGNDARKKQNSASRDIASLKRLILLRQKKEIEKEEGRTKSEPWEIQFKKLKFAHQIGFGSFGYVLFALC